MTRCPVKSNYLILCSYGDLRNSAIHYTLLVGLSSNFSQSFSWFLSALFKKSPDMFIDSNWSKRYGGFLFGSYLIGEISLLPSMWLNTGNWDLVFSWFLYEPPNYLSTIYLLVCEVSDHSL